MGVLSWWLASASISRGCPPYNGRSNCSRSGRIVAVGVLPRRSFGVARARRPKRQVAAPGFPWYKWTNLHVQAWGCSGTFDQTSRTSLGLAHSREVCWQFNRETASTDLCWQFPRATVHARQKLQFARETDCTFRHYGAKVLALRQRNCVFCQTSPVNPRVVGHDRLCSQFARPTASRAGFSPRPLRAVVAVPGPPIHQMAAENCCCC